MAASGQSQHTDLVVTEWLFRSRCASSTTTPEKRFVNPVQCVHFGAFANSFLIGSPNCLMISRANLLDEEHRMLAASLMSKSGNSGDSDPELWGLVIEMSEHTEHQCSHLETRPSLPPLQCGAS